MTKPLFPSQNITNNTINLLHDRPASSNGSAFSKLAAGLSLTPLKDLAFAFGQSVRNALFGSNELVRNQLLRMSGVWPALHTPCTLK